MSGPALIHHLTEIDWEHRTAICSVCGPTGIYIVKNRKYPRHAARVYCMTRIRESGQAQSRRLQGKKQLQNPNQKLRHSLSEINAKKMTAICSVCSKTDIRKRKVGQKGPFYVCAKKKSEYAREYRLTHRVPKPQKSRQSGHSLSEIDDENKTAVCRECGRVRIYVSRFQGKIIRRCSKAGLKYMMQVRQEKEELINKYLLEHNCQRCGYDASHLVLQLHRRNPKEKDDKIYRLVLLSQVRLLRELEKSDVLCMNCHRLVHAELRI